MLGTMGGAMFDPHLADMMCTVSIVLTLTVSWLIIFLSFLSARLDNRVQWKFKLVFIPLFLVDALLLVAVAFQTLSVTWGEAPPLTDDEEEALASLPADIRQQERAARVRRQRRFSLFQASLALLYVVLFVLFQVFIAIRLDEDIMWSTAVVFVPWFIMEFMNLVRLTVEFAHTLVMISSGLSDESVLFRLKLYYNVTFDTFWFFALRVAQAVLLVLRIDETITCHWALVFIPAYLVGLKYLVGIIMIRQKARQASHMNGQGQQLIMFYVALCTFIVVATLAYAFLGLLVRRLEVSDSVRVAILLIPVFIVLSCMWFGVCCCLPCFSLAVSFDARSGDTPLFPRTVSPNRLLTLPSFQDPSDRERQYSSARSTSSRTPLAPQNVS
ncbi:hypothetical protein BJ085DRAFT_24513 [Dimargaris cristalligena]|uniref:Transmembrane protein n=1 Tax=Dimargaris cristalligena TaxID=215637 RepID=A0A4P9ZNN6_9FUNG|nr:hypothetical protein BJ085DRAFT_24513 [Dimargaris cristalligena]|eukprot:RKP34795.1 hypothetical protein BJ085DRAFT_24513 [Dimargaris cristalligena]